MHVQTNRIYFYVPILQHSWKWFLYYRCQNVNRQSRNDSGNSRKRPELDDHIAHVCPPTLAEDDVSFGRNIELLKGELGKPKPRVEVLKDLMRRTFPNRWKLYVNDNEPSTLLEYLSRYPLLKKASFVSIQRHTCTIDNPLHLLVCKTCL